MSRPNVSSIDIVSVRCGGNGAVVGHPVREYDNRHNHVSPCEAYQRLLESSDSEYWIVIHDDVEIHDGDWLARVVKCFVTNPECVVVGLGGATSLGRPDLYRKPYQITNMARGGYVSNQTDWQVHGGLETVCRQVVVCDAFLLAVRRQWLVNRGGWPVRHLSFHCLDLYLACLAARDLKQTYMVGAKVSHYGGGSSTKDSYRDATWLQGATRESDHQEPHRWLADEFKDVLPITL